MSDSTTDYRAIEVPEDTPPEEYAYTVRRAEILHLVEEAGHPDAINQSRLAERYGVARSTISRDFDRIREYYREHLGTHRHAITAAAYRKAIKEYIDRGEYSEAIDALESWNEWLREEGVRDTEAEELEVSGDLLADFTGDSTDT
jgi:transcriptional antiterminator